MLDRIPWTQAEQNAALTISEYDRVCWHNQSAVVGNFGLSLVNTMLKADEVNIERLYQVFPCFKRALQLYKASQDIFFQEFPRCAVY